LAYYLNNSKIHTIKTKAKNLRNQPKYNFFKNTSYALKGLVDLIKTETSFKIELIITILLIPVIIFIDTTLTNKALMFITLMGMILAETTNSAIERVVDLVTLEHHDMAGRAKDMGSAIVFLSIFIFIVTWVIVIIDIL
jgi:diacylglycerol kinase (ATP)